MAPDAHCSENRKGREALLALLDCVPPAGGAVPLTQVSLSQVCLVLLPLSTCVGIGTA